MWPVPPMTAIRIESIVPHRLRNNNCVFYNGARSIAAMSAKMRRREFLGAGAVLGFAALSHAQPKRRLKIGHTGITWGFQPDDAAVAIRDAGSLGYSGYETFGEVLEAWVPKGGLKTALDEARLPLISAY